MKLYRIHFIRHGLTKANETGAYIGKTDYPLSRLGREEILKLSSSISFPNLDAIYSSPSCRCIQTSHLIYPELKPIVIANLSEYDFGDWEGKTANDLKSDETFALWIKGEEGVHPPNGETCSSFHTRVLESFSSLVDGIIQAGLYNCAIVTHAGVISTILSAYGIPRAKPCDWSTKPGCGYSIRMTTQMWMRDHTFEIYDRFPSNFKKNI